MRIPSFMYGDYWYESSRIRGTVTGPVGTTLPAALAFTKDIANCNDWPIGIT